MAASGNFRLYGFWRSLATYRVRIAMALKGISWREDSVDLLEGRQFDAFFRGLNPQSMLPVLETGDGILSQSLAIMEYLDETHPEPPLLPADAGQRAQVRSFALISIADSHPLVVPRIRKHLAQTFGADEETVEAWGRHWLQLGLEAMQQRLAARETQSDFCFGDAPGLADIALASHAAGSRIFGCSFDTVPAVHAIAERCMKLDAFSKNSPQALKPA